jgi:hypothetical protein
MGYNACFFCLGVSSVGLSKEEYTRITHDLTLDAAQLWVKLNPEMTFCYVTGAGTDSSEQGRVAWARVKGATENALMRLFKRSYMFRPGFMKATPGQTSCPLVRQHQYKSVAFVDIETPFSKRSWRSENNELLPQRRDVIE